MFNKNGFFITGTDTDVGKTTYAVTLLNQLAKDGQSTLALKPIASGCEMTELGLRSNDALQLMQAATIKAEYDIVNPITFDLPVAPHILAEKNNNELSLDFILEKCELALTTNADQIIVEGCGGWHCPINRSQTMAELASAISLPVILVVHMRLGCLNHAILSYRSIIDSGCTFAGWVANTYQVESPVLSENISSLTDFLGAEPIYTMA